MTSSLQGALDILEPTLQKIAQQLGHTPEQVLRDAVDAKKRECAQIKPTKPAAQASPSTPKGSLSSEVRRHTAQRNAKMRQK